MRAFFSWLDMLLKRGYSQLPRAKLSLSAKESSTVHNQIIPDIFLSTRAGESKLVESSQRSYESQDTSGG